MHIAFAASECVPFSKTGGLADVVGALPRALSALGHEVSVYVPRYRQTKLSDAHTVVRSITVPFDDHYRFCSIVTGGSHSGRALAPHNWARFRSSRSGRASVALVSAQ